ncbi:exosortase V [Novosphingobium lentum]|uniref:exosortase V n=1 Tax=Novosphingobium lentum TaxID=145287 RepID=UPI00082A326D|nr:exosortase V [Novosphingobium lentum]
MVATAKGLVSRAELLKGPGAHDRIRDLRRNWVLLLAAVVMAAPGLVALAQNYWSTEQGAAGPIVFATGLWLLWLESDGMRRHRDRFALPLAIVAIAGCGLFAITAAVTVKQWLQLLGIYLALVALLYYVFGWRQLLRLWAPVVYLAFVIPPPDNLVIPLTHGLKGFVGEASIALLGALHYPVAYDGGVLFIGPYELVVAAACSGLNSVVSLTAIGLFYVYLLHRSTWRHAAVLALVMVPIALFANIVRVVLLLLLTYHFGEAAGQGVFHQIAGLLIFAIALLSLIGVDALLAPFLASRRRAPAPSRAPAREQAPAQAQTA